MGWTDERKAEKSGDFRPTASLETLHVRARLLAAVRRFFETRGYWEVETPVMSHDIVVDAHLEPFVVPLEASGDAREMFLQTSPEFGMKRLLASGATAIYQVSRVMRRGELGRFHNPEFTMIEWYRTGDTHYDQMQVVEQLVAEAFRAAGRSKTRRAEGVEESKGSKSRKVEASAPFPRIAYDEAFARFAGSRVLHLSPRQLGELAARHGIVPPPGLAADDRDGWLNLLLAELVEPHLGRDRPTFLYDYPASQAALARIRRDDPPVAERFELYIDGIEICNGYHELTDPQAGRPH
jgi:elongation factor P--(R)-beta-lysine ligase